jgi:hypothetical protein
MQPTPQTSEDDIQPVIAPTLAPSETSAPTSAAAPTAASPNADAAAKQDGGTALFGPPLLLKGENLDSWEKLHAAVSAAVVPADIFEIIWTRDIVDHEWNVLRLRRLLVGLITATQQRALADVLRPLMNNGEREYLDPRPELLAWKFALHNADAVKEIKGLLETAGMPWEAVLAQTITFNAETFERIDRMCMAAEARRDAALREIDRRRKKFGARVRRALEQLKPGECFQSEPSGRITVGRMRTDHDQPA